MSQLQEISPTISLGKVCFAAHSTEYLYTCLIEEFKHDILSFLRAAPCVSSSTTPSL